MVNAVPLSHHVTLGVTPSVEHQHIANISPKTRLAETMKLVAKVAAVALSAVAFSFAFLIIVPPTLGLTILAGSICILTGAIALQVAIDMIRGWDPILEAGLDAFLKDDTIKGNKAVAVTRIREAHVELKRFPDNSHVLDLCNLGLTALPESIGLLSGLTKLMLYRNQLSTLPESIGRLVKLKELRLSSNELSSLPQSFGALKELTYLSLFENQLTSLPPDIGNLSKLSKLSLTLNKLERLPEEIGKLTELEDLDLRNNELTTLPAAIGNLTKLSKLYLSQNKLERLPEEVGQLLVLTELHLGNNNLETLSPSLGNLVNLGGLNINNNPRLRELPLSLGNLENITYIGTDQTQDELLGLDAILTACIEAREKNELHILPRRLELWKQFANLKSADFSFITKLEEKDQRTLSEWLLRLSKTAEFGKDQEKTAQVVVKMLLDLNDEEFCKSFIVQAETNNTACGDRAAMALNELYTFWLLHTIETSNSSVKEKIRLLTGSAKSLALRKALQNRISEHQEKEKRIEKEAVEIYLFYETQLKKELDLITAVDHMIYAVIGKREWIDVRALKKEVESKMLEELLSLPQLERIAEQDKKFVAEKEKMNEKFTDEVELIMENESLIVDQINVQIKEVQGRQKEAINALLSRWVEKQLKIQAKQKKSPLIG